MIQKTLCALLPFFVLVSVSGCGGKKTLTVANVAKNAEQLDGKTIRVCGLAYVWVSPSPAEMWRYGGCAPKADPSYRQGYVMGWLALYDSIDPKGLWAHGGPQNAIGLKISESSFDCEGDYCKITCSPFKVTSQQMYEFVGRLKVRENSELILEDIDLDQSSQLVDGKWIPLAAGDFDVMFP